MFLGYNDQKLMKHFFICVSIPVMITVTFARSNQSRQVSLKEDATIQELLSHLCLRPDTCLALVDDQPTPIDSELNDGQHVTIIEVTSGG